MSDLGLTKPNWEEARRLVDTIVGQVDAPAMFQVFDDKGEDGRLAEYRYGRLSDRQIQKWLIVKAKAGCGAFVVVNRTDGRGRRRDNITHHMAAFIDLDGKPLPAEWRIKPDIIVESSKGRWHCYWLLEPGNDLPAWSDFQARLAAYYGGDAKVTDAPRVMRIAGFDHQKSAPFRSRLVECPDPKDALLGEFNRHTLQELVEAHSCEYEAPVVPAEKTSGALDIEWDTAGALERASAYLASLETPETGNRNNTAYGIACKLDDMAISAEKSLELLSRWNDGLDDPLPEHELAHVIKSASRYKQNPPGIESVANAADEFKGAASSTATKEFAGALNVQRASGIEPETLEWLWPARIPLGKLSLLAGFPDQGKSQITINMAATVTKGGEWPYGEGKAEVGGVIILSSEDDAADTLIPRLMAAGADLKKILIVKAMVTEKVESKTISRVFNIEDDLKNLSNVIRQEGENGNPIRMIILDPINAYFGGHKKGDSHKNSDMRALLTPITEWAGRLRLAVVAISHFNKGGNAHTLYRITDSMAITATARAAWFALKDEEEKKMLFVSGKHNLSKAVSGLVYEIGAKDIGMKNIIAPFVEWTGTTDKTAEQIMSAGKKTETNAIKAAKDFLLETIESGLVPMKDITEAANAHGITRATLNRAKAALGVQSFKTDFEAGWAWGLPALADDFIDANSERAADDREFEVEEDEPDFG
jgi:putative DNA primase/helicase